ncbi:MAG: AMP-binding protein, partial [Candidatus Sabulitectum sp.]|nr:AMP-binding protein [Candidatus Sabulitectum sp.]
PVHHLFEGTVGFLLPLACGAEIAIAHGLRYVAADLVTTHATVLLAVPLLWETLYRRIMDNIKSSFVGKAKFGVGLTLSKFTEKMGIKGFRRKVFDPVHEKFGGKLRLLISGGAGIDPKAIEGLEKLGFRMLEGYGLTETAPILSANREKANKYGSVGLLLSEVEGRIDKPDEFGVGEILVKGPNIMLGYYGNTEATAEVLSEDGWFRTGDFGYFDSEGFLFITGRKKNVIIAKNGKNVYPEGIETELNRFRHIKECMVFGRVSETKGEEICALLVPDRDLLIEEAENQNRKITQDDEIKAMRKVVKNYNAAAETYKRIASFIINPVELPKTTTKKIKRNVALKEAGMSPSEVFRP